MNGREAVGVFFARGHTMADVTPFKHRMRWGLPKFVHQILPVLVFGFESAGKGDTPDGLERVSWLGLF